MTIDDEIDQIVWTNDESILSEESEEDSYNIQDFTIDIIEMPNKERKVRMILNINISDNKNIKINLDINSSLYLKIAKDLFN
jgi:hypothetical protein